MEAPVRAISVENQERPISCGMIWKADLSVCKRVEMQRAPWEQLGALAANLFKASICVPGESRTQS